MVVGQGQASFAPELDFHPVRPLDNLENDVLENDVLESRTQTEKTPQSFTNQVALVDRTPPPVSSGVLLRSEMCSNMLAASIFICTNKPFTIHHSLMNYGPAPKPARLIDRLLHEPEVDPAKYVDAWMSKLKSSESVHQNAIVVDQGTVEGFEGFEGFDLGEYTYRTQRRIC
ncbi:hypothetical protein CLCR_09173 [Cladophialophora carrionii]|uniref:Uncharacterized protein n=1 Tax=Cladophialophora carrionii TaxID=86049 RepID=A0A1C1CRX7_9EURO|nr:hypothetical protein CLCR_09173 [Cladophialophora carrionii]